MISPSERKGRQFFPSFGSAPNESKGLGSPRPNPSAPGWICASPRDPPSAPPSGSGFVPLPRPSWCRFLWKRVPLQPQAARAADRRSASPAWSDRSTALWPSSPAVSLAVQARLSKAKAVEDQNSARLARSARRRRPLHRIFTTILHVTWQPGGCARDTVRCIYGPGATASEAMAICLPQHL